MACVVVLDGDGIYHAETLGEYDIPSTAAKELVDRLGLDDRPGEVFHFTVVDETDDPGKARLLGRGKDCLGTFTTK